MKPLVTAVSFVVFVNCAIAQVPGPIEFNDQFNYTSGIALSGQGPWAAIGTGTSTITVLAGNQVYAGYSQSIGAQVELFAASGNKANRRTLTTAISADIVYAYYLVNFSALPSGTEMFFALRNASGTSEDGIDLPGSRPLKVSARTVSGKVELGIRKRGGPRAFATAKPLTIGTTYLVVASYSFVPGTSNDEVRLWINPVTLPGVSGEPAADVSTSSGSDGFQITGTTLRESVAGGSLRLDDLTVKKYDPTLPVELVDLSVNSSGSNATISWTAISDEPGTGFTVEQQAGDTFAAIGFVPGRSFSNEMQDYSFVVSDLSPGLQRFRLRQTDVAGSFVYSSIIEALIEVAGPYVLNSPYPNPFSDQSNVTFGVGDQTYASLRLYDLLGREVQVVHEGSVAPDAMIDATIDGSSLAPGIYVLRLDGSNFSTTRLVVRR